MPFDFHHFARRAACLLGTSWAFLAACATIVVWLVCGPVFGFSDTWQLIINTSTTIVTFLMVFLIQNTQNRDAEAIHLKLDELIHSIKEARNSLIDLEDCTDEEMAALKGQFEALRKKGDATPAPQNAAGAKA